MSEVENSVARNASEKWQFANMNILYEDHHLVAVNKPAPLLTQAPAGIPSLEAMVKAYIKEKYAKPAGVYLGIPHRLDRPVSGVVLFARNTKAAQRVHAQFQDRRVQKTYWAIVQGHVVPKSGLWEDWIRKLVEESRVERAVAGEAGAKEAVLEYQVEALLPDGTTWLELRPRTGRTHQLRVQTAWRGHPILGDTTYAADVTAFGPKVEQPRDRIIALHARSLLLTHPFTEEPLRIEASLPEYWPEKPEKGDRSASS